MAKVKDACLPGIDAAELKALEDALTAYKDVQTQQSGEQSGATTSRQELKQLVGAIADQRPEIQFAAAGLWPANKSENADICREFGLPPEKTFNG